MFLLINSMHEKIISYFNRWKIYTPQFWMSMFMCQINVIFISLKETGMFLLINAIIYYFNRWKIYTPQFWMSMFMWQMNVIFNGMFLLIN